MDLRFEHQCSQCGALIRLFETERLLQCRFCGVKSYLSSEAPFHFVLPHQAPPDRELLYVPYLRFRGNVFSCQGNRTDFRFTDITQLGIPFEGLPASLGFRTQALTLKLLDPATPGTFLRPTLKLTDLLNKVSQLGAQSSQLPVYHRAHIGETTSLVFLPLYRQEDQLFDAVINEPALSLRRDQEINPDLATPLDGWRLNVLATVCPVCGWQLEGDKDSVAMVCRNCERVWETSSGRFALTDHVVVPDIGGEKTHLPFWKITATATGVPIKTFADFIRATHQPRVPLPEWEELPMSFWCPAFKIRPKIFLQLLRTATLAQPSYRQSERFRQKPLFPVTLPSSEAVQTLKVTLADLSLKKKDIFPLLPKVRFNVVKTTLVYLAFRDTGHELIQPCSQIVINKNSLDFGRKL
ncbi:MAG: hypothetical protein JXB25_08890 [Deltaproteobacteria bacterium]|nr:hypothetical protein [Deltaproteobacteria bacterium]